VIGRRRVVRVAARGEARRAVAAAAAATRAAAEKRKPRTSRGFFV
jgi:hypothetical protein